MIKLKELLNEASMSSDSKKFLKGMKKIPLKAFAKMYMPGQTYVWYDSKSKKFYYLDSDGDYMELRNENTLKELYKFLQTQSITLESVNEATPEEEDEFHRNLDKLVHKTFGHSSDEKKMNEDIDIGHTDDEPDMLAADLSVIARYASELEEMMGKLETMGDEVDLPHWWQSKVIKAKDYLIAAKHYLRYELEKPTKQSNGLETPIAEAIEFTNQQLSQLKDSYKDIKTMNPTSPVYKKLINFLNSLDSKALKQISNADIKWLSMLAKNRLKEGEEIDEYDVETIDELNDFQNFMKEYKSPLTEAEYQGRKVELGKPMQGDVKKFKVYVNNDKGNVVKVNFGQKGMVIKKDNPDARKSFRARMNCDEPGPRWKARYWSCRKW